MDIWKRWGTVSRLSRADARYRGVASNPDGRAASTSTSTSTSTTSLSRCRSPPPPKSPGRLRAPSPSPDLPAVAFYERKLGLSAVETGADGSKVYSSGGDEALVVYPSPDHAGRSTATLAIWYVDDVEHVVDDLTSNGVTFEHYEGVLESGFDYGTDEKGISPGGGKVAWFKDPDGNLFSIEGDR